MSGCVERSNVERLLCAVDLGVVTCKVWWGRVGGGQTTSIKAKKRKGFLLWDGKNHYHIGVMIPLLLSKGLPLSGRTP